MTSSKGHITLAQPVAKYYGFENDGIPPYAILYVGSELKKAGYDVSIYHGSNADEFLSLIRRDEVFVGLSSFTGYPVKIACDFAKASKKLYPNLTTVLGGYHATLVKEQVLNDDFFDFICVGEGELTAIILADRIISGKKDFGDILGIGWKDAHGGIHINEKRPFPKNIDFPIDEELANWGRYTPKVAHLGNKRLLYLFTSRGCPFFCTFCAATYLYDRSYRKESPESVIANYKPIIEKYNVDILEFLDDNFMVDIGWAEKVALGLGRPYRALMRVDRINEKTCDLLNRTRCRALFTGIESGNEDVRMNIMEKKTTNETVIKGLTLLREKCPTINMSAMFIAGIPGETYEQFRDTCRFAMKITKINPRVVTQCNVYAPYPYCKSYEEAVKAGWEPPAKTEDWVLDSKLGSDLYPIWLKWNKIKDPKKLKRKFDLTANMFMLLRKENEHLKGWKKWAKKVLEMIARFRLEYDFYFLPLEMEFFWKMYKRIVKSDIILDNEMKTWGQGKHKIPNEKPAVDPGSGVNLDIGRFEKAPEPESPMVYEPKPSIVLPEAISSFNKINA